MQHLGFTGFFGLVMIGLWCLVGVFIYTVGRHEKNKEAEGELDNLIADIGKKKK